MPPTVAPSPGRLTGERIGILLEKEFIADEISYYRRRFTEEGAEVLLLTRLWGQPALTFTGADNGPEIQVPGDLEKLGYGELSELAALIVPSGMVADRLRYSEDVDRPAPAVELMRRAFRLPKLVKAFSCHGLLLMSTAADLMQDRQVTCHNNLIGDVRNMGARYTNQDLVADADLLTSRTVDHCHLLARAVIEMVGPGNVR
jgi:deglycase